MYSDVCSEDFLKQRTMQNVPDGTCWKSPIPYYDSPVDTSKPFDLTAAVYPYAPYVIAPPEGYTAIDTSLRPWIDNQNLHWFYRKDAPVPLVVGGQPAPLENIFPQDAWTLWSRPAQHVHEMKSRNSSSKSMHRN